MNFELTHASGTVAGEAERMLRAHVASHDPRWGLGGYYLTKVDTDRLTRIFGPDAEAILAGAGWEPDPRPRRKGWWTGSRAPGGDPCAVRLRIKWSWMEAVARYWGARETDTATQNCA